MDSFSKSTYFYVTSLVLGAYLYDGKRLLRKQYLRIEYTVVVFSAVVVVYDYLYGVKVRGSVSGTFP